MLDISLDAKFKPGKILSDTLIMDHCIHFEENSTHTTDKQHDLKPHLN